MGRLLKHRAKDNKWRLWSNNSDQWLTDWITEDEIKEYLAYRHEIDYKVEVIKLYMSFPDGYYDQGTSWTEDRRPYSAQFENRKGTKAFYDWQTQAFKGDYYEEVDRKFKEITERIA